MVSIWPHGANTYPRMQCVQVRFNQACKSTGRAEIVCKIFLQVWNVRSIMQPLLFPIPKKIQGVAIISKHSYQKFFFLRAFQAPLKSNIKFQGFSRTSRSSTNQKFVKTKCENAVTKLLCTNSCVWYLWTKCIWSQFERKLKSLDHALICFDILNEVMRAVKKWGGTPHPYTSSQKKKKNSQLAQVPIFLLFNLMSIWTKNNLTSETILDSAECYAGL